jgi:hypothetical protein
MRNMILLGLVVFFAGACGHKAAQTETPAAATPSAANPATTDTKHKTKSKVKTDANNAVSGDSVTCSHGSEERTLEIKAKDSGCELVYTKGGNANSIATAANGKQHCQDVSTKIQGKLTGAGFTCK